MIEKDGSYHVYCGNASNEILSIDSKGKIDIKNTDLAKYLEEVDLESLIEENEKVPERLKVISKKTVEFFLTTVFLLRINFHFFKHIVYNAI